jgi:hypothetical protein
VKQREANEHQKRIQWIHFSPASFSALKIMKIWWLNLELGECPDLAAELRFATLLDTLAAEDCTSPRVPQSHGRSW